MSDAVAPVPPVAAGGAGEQEPEVVFRNYRPSDKALQSAVATDEAAPMTDLAQRVKEQEEAAAAQLSSAPGATRELTIAPKKANWDLKRDSAARFDRLERLTQRAIRQILQAKLAGDEVAVAIGDKR